MRSDLDAGLLCALLIVVTMAACSPVPANLARRPAYVYRPAIATSYGVPLRRSGTALTTASWYGPGFNGRRTAGGEVYHQERMTAASTVMPLGSTAEVTNL